MVGGNRLTKGFCGVQRVGDEVGSGEGPLPGVPTRDRRPTVAGQAHKPTYHRKAGERPVHVQAPSVPSRE